VPEVLDDLSLLFFFFFEVGVEQEFFFSSVCSRRKEKETINFFFLRAFSRLVLSLGCPLLSVLPRAAGSQSSLPTWWIEISTAVQVQMPATASRGLLEETSIIFDAFFLSFFSGCWAVFLLLYSRSGVRLHLYAHRR